MRDYGRVHTTFWSSETMRSLDEDARMLALYLLTCPHAHMAGVFHLPTAYIAHDIGWVAERLAKGFETLSDAGWLRRCERTGWVWIINFTKFNPPDNPNMRKAVAKQEALVPAGCSFKAEIETVSKGFPNPLGNLPVPAPVPVQEKKTRGRKKSAGVPLSEWVANLGGADAVPADDPIFAWASEVRLPRGWIALAWWVFEGRYTEARPDKLYTDWRQAFRDHVRGDFLKLWAINRDGEYYLTTTGKQAEREMGA